MMAFNNAVNTVRKQEVAFLPTDTLTKTKYLFLKNPENLTEKQKERLDEIIMNHKNLKTVQAYHMKLNFKDFWKCDTRIAGEHYLQTWCNWASSLRLTPMLELIKTIRKHWRGILNYFSSRITNGKIEAINGQIQKLKREARGYRNIGNFKNAILLRYGKLELGIPLTTF